MKQSIFLVLALALPLPSAAAAQSVWMHNKSEMLLEEDKDGNIIISYLSPRVGLSAKPGDFVFSGSYEKQEIDGIARLFSEKCGSTGYEVSGQISRDKKTITLTGGAPIRDANCRESRVRTDKLIFTYVRERGSLDTGFIGEWSSYQPTCDETEAQQGPILNYISPRGFGYYESYCAFSQISGPTDRPNIKMICSTMGNNSSDAISMIKSGRRVAEIQWLSGASVGAKQTLYKCPINSKDLSADPSTPENLSTAEEEYFARVSDEARGFIISRGMGR